MTTDGTSTLPTPNLTQGFDLNIDLTTLSSSSSSSTSANVTLEPEDDLDDDYLPLLLGSQEEVVTQLPEDPMTVQYMVEGEKVRPAVGVGV